VVSRRVEIEAVHTVILRPHAPGAYSPIIADFHSSDDTISAGLLPLAGSDTGRIAGTVTVIAVFLAIFIVIYTIIAVGLTRAV
jgi:uncharacterized membrane-anchored protein